MLKNKFSKILSFCLAGAFLLTSVPVSAYEIPLDEDKNSVETVEYEEHEIRECDDKNFSAETQVLAKVKSEYKVTIPKVIVLSGATKRADYQVYVEGDLAGYEVLHVLPDDHVDLYTKNKAKQPGDIIQDVTSWRWDELNNGANGYVKADGITAGKWSGNFNFLIWIEDLGEDRVLGDIILPVLLDDDYKLVIKKLGKPGLYNANGVFIEGYDAVVASYPGFDPSVDNNSVSEILNTNYPEARYVVLPDSVTRIADNTFSSATINYVGIPSSVTSIVSNTFSSSTVFTNIPKSVTSVGSNVPKSYYNSKKVKTITIDLENNDSADIELEKGCMYEITALYNFVNNVTKESTIVSSDENVVKFIPECYLDAVEIGNCVISGTYYTQDGRQKHAEIRVRVKRCDDEYNSFPFVKTEINQSTLAQLGYTMQMFNRSEFKALVKNGQIVRQMVIPSMYEYNGQVYKFTGVGYGAFGAPSCLESVTLPEGITYIGDYAFGNCYDLKNVDIPKTVTSIGEGAFQDSGLEHFVWPEQVKTIKQYTFRFCGELVVEVPDSVTTIGAQAFRNCKHVYYYGSASGRPWEAKAVN